MKNKTKNKQVKFLFLSVLTLFTIILASNFILAWDSGLNSGLLTSWKFDANGTMDSVGSKTLTLYGTPVHASNSSCISGQCYNYDSSDYLTNATGVDTSGFPTSNNEVTIAVWFRSNDTSGNAKMFYSYGLDSNYIRFYAYNNKIDFGQGARSEIESANNTWFNDNWHLAVGTLNSSQLTLYVDGVRVAEDGTNIGVDVGGLAIGGGDGVYSGGGDNFVGYLDEISVWNRSLTSAEISELWNHGSGSFYESEVNETEPVTIPFNVSLDSPDDNFTSTSTSVLFDCDVDDADSLLNITLFVDGVANYTITNSTGNQTDIDFSTTLDFANGTSHTWYCQAFSQTYNDTSSTRSFSILLPPVPPTPPQPDVTSNVIYQVMNSSGAGLGIFLQFMAQSLPVLLIILALVGIVIVVGYAIAHSITYLNFFKGIV